MIFKWNLPICQSAVAVIVVVVWIRAAVLGRTDVALLVLTIRLTAARTMVLCASIFIDFICIQSVESIHTFGTWHAYACGRH